jgi:transcriptional regulator with XRE-family HTH domain
MADSFGARLRQRREDRGIALLTIAEQTKIKLSLLQALERDDVSHWPPGIFRRAYIRAYAHAIGLDPDLIVVEFLEAHPDPAEVVTTEAIASAIDGGRTNGGPPTRLRNIVGSAIDSLSRLRRGPVIDEPPHAAAPPVPARASAATDAPDYPGVAAASIGDADDRGASAHRKSFHPRAETARVVAGSRQPVEELAASEPDLLAVARVCTELGRVEDALELQRLLQEVAGILEAPGLVVWVWDQAADALRPALVHGYSDQVVAQLPTVGRDADNATAAAFRDGEARGIKGSGHASGALVVPLLTPDGCAGVLAIELQQGRGQTGPLTAIATIFASMLAQLVGRAQTAELENPVDDESLAEAEPFLPLRGESSSR